MYYYCLTLQKNDFPIFPCYYDTFIVNFRSKYPFAELVYHFEEGPHKKLHIHGMIKTPRRIYINRLHPGEGYSCKLEFVKSQLAWDFYIRKGVKSEKSLLDKWRQDEVDFFTPPEDLSEEYIEIPKIQTRIV